MLFLVLMQRRGEKQAPRHTLDIRRSLTFSYTDTNRTIFRTSQKEKKKTG
jgi:hypothetical protein